MKKYDFHPLWVYVLFGLTGALSETLSFGPASLLNAGLYIRIPNKAAGCTISEVIPCRVDP